jgi:hypothetical protein
VCAAFGARIANTTASLSDASSEVYLRHLDRRDCDKEFVPMAAARGSRVIQTMLKRLASDERINGTEKSAGTVGTMTAPVKRTAS